MDKYNWRQWFSKPEDIENTLHYIRYHTTLDLPHVIFINGPPFTGKKTFAKIVQNIFQEESTIYVCNIGEKIVEKRGCKLYFIIGHSYPSSIRTNFLNGLYTYSTIIFTTQFLHERPLTDSYIKYCENTLRADLNMEYELILPSPVSRQTSCGSYFISSPSRQVSESSF